MIAADAGARIDALLARYNALDRFNGSALVARDGKVLLARGYGMASFEMGAPNRPDTKHWIGSVTKVFTATMVMRLADQGKLSLDSTVADLLPWYRKDTGGRITVRHLLTHTSGLPDYMHLPGIGRDGFRQQAGDDPIEVKAFAEKWCSADLAWEPGTKWGYSNSGYVLLGAIAEQVTGQPFEKALQTLVLEPAGMRDTGDLAARPRDVVPGLTAGYERGGGGVVTRRPWNMSTAFGAGAMYSTVEDLQRFDEALYGDRLVSPAGRAAMFTPGVGGYGCGWEVQSLPIGPGKADRTVAGHEGYIFWSIARIYRIEQDHVFVALVNNTGDAQLPAMFAGIADILYGREPFWPKPSAAEAVHRIASETGGEAAVSRYRELQKTAAEEYEFTERGLNALGYALIAERRSDAAVAVFRLMVDTYPDSANGWDSLGEGLAAAGQRGEAIKAYARSLELNPGNSGAVDALARLNASR